MDNKIPPFRPDVIGIKSAPRPTPATPHVKFGEVLKKGAQGLVAGAEAALNALPGGPLMAVALRGAGGVSGSLTTPMSVGGSGGSITGTSALGGSLPANTASPEGPGAAATGTATGAPTDGGIQASLQQSQEMNLYYLQIQEEVNAQNRTFSALSNVIKAEHDTVKTAIGNIH